MYFLQHYKQILAQNFLPTIETNTEQSSSFFNITTHSIGIENNIGVVAQYLYLYLLTGKNPFMSKKYPSKKKVYRYVHKKNSVKISCWPTNIYFGYLINLLFYEFPPRQLSPEFPSVTISDKNLKVIVWNATLLKKTFSVQTSPNLFVNDIPMYYRFQTKSLTLSEISFFVIFCNFLRINDIAEESLEMDEYNYRE